ncbi:MAG: Gfo/Idh/MocA family oxidoreductase [Chloroflexota bacterium]|nr:MAG: Gfo/Idh/MocA family oxidoreductase [Chloroflexota bacterium]
MADRIGFVTMGEARSAEGEIPSLGVGMLGYAFMGKAHSNAFIKMPYIFWPPPARPKLVAIAGRNQAATAEAARRYGYAKTYQRWQDMVTDPEIQVFDNGAPNDLHAEPCIAAAEAGKHVICEKPLGRNAAESKRMLDAVTKAGVKHACAFNYRFVPAIRLARDIVDAGKLGKIRHFRATYLQEWITDPEFPAVWRLQKARAGSGVLGDLGAHIIDLARYLVGEPKTVNALTRTFITDRPSADTPGKREKVDVDDAFVALVDFASGTLGTLEASRFARGRKNANRIEINGEKGSIAFNLERLNELEVYLPDEHASKELVGFTNISVTESYHPFWNVWWPHGHVIGWEHLFVHEVHHFFDAIVNDKPIAPHGATFEDGYRASVICDAILASAASGGSQVAIAY